MRVMLGKVNVVVITRDGLCYGRGGDERKSGARERGGEKGNKIKVNETNPFCAVRSLKKERLSGRSSPPFPEWVSRVLRDYHWSPSFVQFITCVSMALRTSSAAEYYGIKRPLSSRLGGGGVIRPLSRPVSMHPALSSEVFSCPPFIHPSIPLSPFM